MAGLDAGGAFHSHRETAALIESYNDFSQWITFGGDGILKSRDPVENEKVIKYKELIANAIMLQNVVDMTDVLHDYVIDLETIPPPFLTPEETGMKETAVQ